jgi:hypothetical protein
MLHKVSRKKWREVYKMHKSERAGRARSAGVLGQKEKTQGNTFALEICGEV